jgi:hypothetical protein
VRAAGADAETAARLAAVRERLLARRYGPELNEKEDAALVTEVREVVQRLGGSVRGWSGRAALAGLAIVVLAGRLMAQAPPPERLYESGALRAAAEGFSRRAELEPMVAAHWYNLGAAYYRLGYKGRATTAWLRAQRLDPRQPAISRALRLTPPPDATSSRWTWSPPVTPEELLLLGLLGWVVGWIGWIIRPRVRERWIMVLVFAAIAGLGGVALRLWYQRQIAIVIEPTTLRLSPHGRAPALGPVDAGGAVLMLRVDGDWVLVRAAGAREGWLTAEAIAPIGG